MNASFDITDIKLETKRLILRPWSLNDLDDYDYISAMDNIYAMQEEARKSGAANMTLDEINAEIRTYREGH